MRELPRPVTLARHGARLACAVMLSATLMGCATVAGGAAGSAIASSAGSRAGRAAVRDALVANPAAARFAAGRISAEEAGIRYGLAVGDTLTAYSSIAALESDTLLRLLHWGLAHHRLGRWEASNRALQEAEELAEIRYTASVRQALATLLVNDTKKDYIPPAHERAYMHYYGMLNYLALGDQNSALVEARKANQYLERYSRENGGRTYTIDGSVEYLAGMLHLGAGDKNDAIISFRKASEAFETYRGNFGLPTPRFFGADMGRLATELGIDDVKADAVKKFSLTPQDLRPVAGQGQLVVMIENGFIAHRVQQKLNVPILRSEADALKNGGITGALPTAINITDRTMTLFTAKNEGANVNVVQTNAWGFQQTVATASAQDVEDVFVLGAVVSGGELISLAWPKYELNANAAEDVFVSVGNVKQQSVVMNDLSAIAARTFEEDKPRIIQRMLVRAVGKYALVKFGERKAEAAGSRFGGEWGARIAGGAARLGGQAVASATERADIRSWSSLPAEIRVARFALAPGEHKVSLTVVDGSGQERVVDLGTVKIAAGKVAVRSAFVDGANRGERVRFANAMRGIEYRAAKDVATGEDIVVPVVGAGALMDGPAVAVGSVATVAAAPVAIPAGAPAAAPPAVVPKPPAVVAAAVVGVLPVSAAYRPMMNESARFAPVMRGGAKAGRSTLTLIANKDGSADSVAIWTGSEGDTVTWNGFLGNQQAAPGLYRFIMRAETPGATAPTSYAFSLALQQEAPNGTEMAEEPEAPEMEKETQQVMRPDYGKKKGRIRNGIILGALGAGVSTYGYMQASNAIKNTPPGSAERSMSFNMWAGGLGVAALGGFVMSRGMFKDYQRSVEEPNAEAIRRNAEAKEEHARKVAAVREQNTKVKETVTLRWAPAGTGGRRQ
jgi:uncharacterized protein